MQRLSLQSGRGRCPLRATKNPLGVTGRCLALAAFVKRPQADAQIGAGEDHTEGGPFRQHRFRLRQVDSTEQPPGTKTEPKMDSLLLPMPRAFTRGSLHTPVDEF